MNPEDLRYSKEHEWVRIGPDGTAEVGITAFAAESLGDVVFVDLPAAGATLTQFEKFGEIESVKAVSDLFSPVSGSVVEVNGALSDGPQLVNDGPYAEGWLLRVELADASEAGALMSADDYERFLSAEGG